MFLNVLIFVAVLLLTFAVIFLVIRPTASERTIEERIRSFAIPQRQAPRPPRKGHRSSSSRGSARLLFSTACCNASGLLIGCNC